MEQQDTLPSNHRNGNNVTSATFKGIDDILAALSPIEKQLLRSRLDKAMPEPSLVPEFVPPERSEKYLADIYCAALHRLNLCIRRARGIHF